MFLLDTCNDCIRTVLDEDLLPIIEELEHRDTPALEVTRNSDNGGYTEFTFIKSDLSHIMAVAREEDPESWEFFKSDCLFDEGTYTCSCCGEIQPTMTIRFPTLDTKSFVRAAAISIYHEWCDEFYPGFYS